MAIAIDRARADEPDTLRLISELDSYLAGLYPAESNHGLPVEQLRQPNVVDDSLSVFMEKALQR